MDAYHAVLMLRATMATVRDALCSGANFDTRLGVCLPTLGELLNENLRMTKDVDRAPFNREAYAQSAINDLLAINALLMDLQRASEPASITKQQTGIALSILAGAIGKLQDGLTRP